MSTHDSSEGFAMQGGDSSNDTAPIVGYSNRLVILGQKVTLKSLLIAVLVFFCALLFVIFLLAGLLGHSSTQCKKQPDGGDATNASKYCSSTECLYASARLLSYANRSADPCQNFYQFACGNFSTLYPVPTAEKEVTIFSIMSTKNQYKVKGILVAPLKRNTINSFERKVKDFYQSCLISAELAHGAGAKWILNIIEETVQKQDKIDKPLGEKLTDAVSKIRWKYWTESFFSLSTMTQPPHTLVVSRGGLSLAVDQYKENMTRDAYKTYIQRIASLLARDSGSTDRQFENFMDDVMDIEDRLAKIDYPTNGGLKFFKVAQLNKEMPPFDWLKFLQAFVGTESVNQNSSVLVTDITYLRNVSEIIANYETESANKGWRILSHYLMWRLVQQYSNYLSIEYFNARQAFDEVVNKDSVIATRDEFCFQVTKNAMPEALDSLFVATYATDMYFKKLLNTMFITLKEVLYHELLASKWMDSDTLIHALDKVKDMKPKFVYPQYLMSNKYMDQIYSKFSVNMSDFYGNLMAWNEHQKESWIRKVLSREPTRDWGYRMFEVFNSWYNIQNELYIPSGVLQFPFFGRRLPFYVQFGGFGSHMGHEMIKAIDEFGAQHGIKDNVDWWTNKTRQKYQPLKKCSTRRYANMSAGPFYLPRSKTFESISMAPNAQFYVINGIAETAGIKLAYEAYHKLTKTEPDLLGKFTANQTFFLAYAQTRCASRSGQFAYMRAKGGAYPNELIVNGALQDLPQFKEAFRCSKGSKMNPQKKCEIF